MLAATSVLLLVNLGVQSAPPVACSRLLQPVDALTQVTGWGAAAAEALRREGEPAATDIDDATGRTLLCDSAPCLTTPFGTVVADDSMQRAVLVVPGERIGVAVLQGVYREYHCTGEASVGTSEYANGWVRLRGFTAYPRVVGVSDATGKACDHEEDPGCSRACFHRARTPLEVWVHGPSGQAWEVRKPAKLRRNEELSTVAARNKAPPPARVGRCTLDTLLAR